MEEERTRGACPSSRAHSRRSGAVGGVVSSRRWRPGPTGRLIDLVLGAVRSRARFFEVERVVGGGRAGQAHARTCSFEAARRLDVPPGRCAAIEDSGNGLRAAHAAGMRVIAIPNGPLSAPRPTRSLSQTSCSTRSIAELTPSRDRPPLTGRGSKTVRGPLPLPLLAHAREAIYFLPFFSSHVKSDRTSMSPNVADAQRIVPTPVDRPVVRSLVELRRRPSRSRRRRPRSAPVNPPAPAPPMPLATKWNVPPSEQPKPTCGPCRSTASAVAGIARAAIKPDEDEQLTRTFPPFPDCLFGWASPCWGASSGS